MTIGRLGGVLFAVLFFGAFVGVGVWLIVGGIQAVRLSNAVEKWPTTRGTIESAKLEENHGGEDTTYRVRVEYSYVVDGVAYRGKRLAFGYGGSSVRESHEDLLRKLQNAKTVVVRYDPGDFGNSSLSYGVHNSIVVRILFGILWLGAVIGFLIVIGIQNRRDRALLAHLVTTPSKVVDEL